MFICRVFIFTFPPTFFDFRSSLDASMIVNWLEGSMDGWTREQRATRSVGCEQLACGSGLVLEHHGTWGFFWDKSAGIAQIPTFRFTSFRAGEGSGSGIWIPVAAIPTEEHICSLRQIIVGILSRSLGEPLYCRWSVSNDIGE